MSHTPHPPRSLRATLRRLMRESWADLGTAKRRAQGRKWRETDPDTLTLMGIDVEA